MGSFGESPPHTRSRFVYWDFFLLTGGISRPASVPCSQNLIPGTELTGLSGLDPQRFLNEGLFKWSLVDAEVRGKLEQVTSPVSQRELRCVTWGGGVLRSR